MRKLSNEYVSAFKDMIKTPTFMFGATAGLAGFGARTLQDYRHKKQQQQAKVVAYKEMLDLHPHLKERDPSEISRVYNSLHNVSPNMARDPMVAGAWVDQIVEMKTPGQNAHHALLNAVKDLSGIQKNVLDNERSMRPDHAGVERLEKGIRALGPMWEHGQDRALELARKQRKLDFSAQVKGLEEDRAKAIADVVKRERALAGRAAELAEREKGFGKIEQNLNTFAQHLNQRGNALDERESMFHAAFERQRRPGHPESGRAAPVTPAVRPDIRPGLVPSKPYGGKTASAGDLKSMLRALRV